MRLSSSILASAVATLLIVVSFGAGATAVSDIRARIINQYLRTSPPETWDYDWTTAVFLFGAASSYRPTDAISSPSFSPDDMRRALAKVDLKKPSAITMPDLAALSLPAVLLLDQASPNGSINEKSALSSIIDASKNYLASEPLNAGGVLNHVGRNHKFGPYFPPTFWFMPSSVWADSSIMYGLNGFMLALHDQDLKRRDFYVDQVLKIHSLLWDSKAQLYKHAYFFGSKTFAPANSYWARGNLWMTLAMTEILARLPKDHPRYLEMNAILNNHVASLSKRVDHQKGLLTLLDYQSRGNYFETSASALYAYAVLKGTRLGLLPMTERSTGRSVALGLFNQLKKVDATHTSVAGISCPTTATSYDSYYVYLVRTCADQSYGVGAILLMLSEL